MTGAEYRMALERLDLSEIEVARLLDINTRTSKRWLADEVPVPQAVAILLQVAIKKKLKPNYLLSLIQSPN